jgi:uncharacterized protein with beta-barrel porin domain
MIASDDLTSVPTRYRKCVMCIRGPWPHGTTALLIFFTLAATALPALADGGAGGAGSNFSTSGAGGAGGTGFVGNNGADGGGGLSYGGGGGGGGAGGGVGGAGGTSSFLSLENGAVGGAGGANGNGAGAPTISNSGILTGGNGGNGGATGNSGGGFGGGGGGGGAGGYGAVVTGGGVSSNAGTIAGGAGGGGGVSGFGTSGNGGDGGVGIQFTAPTASFTNSGGVSGGVGGAGGAAGATAGQAGLGGAGIVGSGLTIINSGSIEGGLAGDNVTRSNAITFTGGTNVLELQAGSSITGNVVAFSAADTLQLGGTTSASFDVSQIGVQYLDFGNFGKVGSSTWTLTGNTNATLSWSIAAGTLNVTGTMANSAMTANSGGTLAGTGTVGATQVNAGGFLAPGNGTPGTSLTISGNLAFQSGAIYLVQVNSSTASFANVTGTATLGGATVNATYASGSYISKQYTILTAGNVSGTFGSLVNTNLPANFHTTLSYDAKDAYLNLTLNYTPPTTPNFGGGLNINQQNVANTLTSFFNATGGIPLVFGTLTPAGLSQVSGEVATGSQQTTFDAMNLFMGVMTDPFSSGRGDGVTSGANAPTGYASTQTSGAARDAYAMFTKAPPVTPFEQRWSVWAAGFGGSQTTDGNATLGSNTSTSSVYGTAVGADYRISPFTVAGFALAGGGTNFSVAGSGSGHSDLFQAGAFIRHTVGQAYISAALAYGWQDITTDRTVTVAGSDQLRAQFNANAFSGRLEGGYRFVAPWVGGVGITPYAAAQFTTFDLPAYAEQAIVGSNAFALAYNAKDVTDTRSELGIRTDKSFAMTDGVLILRARVAWAHDYDPDRSIAATFQSLPGASFVVNGAAQAADSALVTAGLEKKWLTGWSAAATFEGEFSDVTRSYAGKGVVRYTW